MVEFATYYGEIEGTDASTGRQTCKNAQVASTGIVKFTTSLADPRGSNLAYSDPRPTRGPGANGSDGICLRWGEVFAGLSQKGCP